MQKSYRVRATFGPQSFISQETITATEVASLLNMKIETFNRRRHHLHTVGLPRPIPGTTRTFSRPNVLAWIHGHGATHALPGAAQDPVEAARDALEARMQEGRQ